jgi:hypothetical protein
LSAAHRSLVVILRRAFRKRATATLALPIRPSSVNPTCSKLKRIYLNRISIFKVLAAMPAARTCNTQAFSERQSQEITHFSFHLMMALDFGVIMFKSKQALNLQPVFQN